MCSMSMVFSKYSDFHNQKKSSKQTKTKQSKAKQNQKRKKMTVSGLFLIVEIKELFSFYILSLT